MLKIALVDDDKVFVEYEKGIIEHTLAQLDLDAQINVYFNGKTFLSNISNSKIDLVFLDIDMPCLGGFEVAKNIRNKYKDCFIVFVSNHENFVYNSFEFSPIAFIRKPVFKNEIANVFERLLDMQTDNEGCLLIKFDGESIKCSINDITYIESDKNNAIVHTVNTEYTYNKKISNLWEEISNCKFLFPHRCYLVNFKYIKSMRKDEFVLKDNTLVPISRHRQKEVFKQFESYLRNQI